MSILSLEHGLRNKLEFDRFLVYVISGELRVVVPELVLDEGAPSDLLGRFHHLHGDVQRVSERVPFTDAFDGIC